MEQRPGGQDRSDGAAVVPDLVTGRGPLPRQRGQETLQAMLAVAFMLLPVLFGIIELGGLIHVWIGQQSAAAIGARMAGERGEDDALVRDRIGVELRTAGLDPARVQIKVAPAYVHW